MILRRSDATAKRDVRDDYDMVEYIICYVVIVVNNMCVLGLILTDSEEC